VEARRGLDRLAASGWFLKLDEPILAWDPVAERIGVLYRVQERPWSNRVSLVLGGGSGATSGALDLDFFGLFGAGRRWRLRSDWQGHERNRLDLNLVEPRLLGRPLSVELGFVRVDQDSTFLQQGLQLDLRLLLPAGWEGIAGIGFERSLLGTSGASDSEMSRRRHRFGVAWQSLDPDRPGERRLRLLTDLLIKKSNLPGEPANENQWQGKITGQWAWPISRLWRLRARGGADLLHARGQQGFNAAELAPLGGALSLRGYDEEHFRGDRVGFGGLELGVGDPLELYLFADYGRGRWRQPDRSTTRFSGWGLGVGLQAPAPRGRFTLALAVGEEKRLDALRVHLALDSGF